MIVVYKSLYKEIKIKKFSFDKMKSFFICISILIISISTAFNYKSVKFSSQSLNPQSTLLRLSDLNKEFSVQVPLGEGIKDYTLKLRPLFENSEVFVTTLPIPFTLNIEPQGLQLGKKVIKLPTVTKDGTNGEKRGDILRATTCWVQGMQGSGPGSDIMNFAGMVKWQKSIFD